MDKLFFLGHCLNFRLIGRQLELFMAANEKQKKKKKQKKCRADSSR